MKKIKKRIGHVIYSLYRFTNSFRFSFNFTVRAMEPAPNPTPEEPMTAESFVVYNNNPEENLNYEKITYQDAKARHYRLVSLVDRHPDVKRRDNLKIDLKTMRSLKKHQGGTRTMAIVFGGVAIGGVAMYSFISAASYGGIVDPVFAMQPMIFGALGVGFGAGSIALTVKLNEKRKEFVNRYNE